MKIYCNKQNHNLHELEYEIINGEIRVDTTSCPHCRQDAELTELRLHGVKILDSKLASEFVDDMEVVMSAFDEMLDIIESIQPLIRRGKAHEKQFEDILEALEYKFEAKDIVSGWYNIIADKKKYNILVTSSSK